VTRFVSALRMETTVLIRQHFAAAAMISGLLWLAALLPMPRHVRPIVEPYILMGDIAIIGFFFVGAAVFYEKQERTIGAVICSPLRFHEYLIAKVAVLVGISLLVAGVVVVAASGTGVHPAPLVAGVLLGTVVMLLVGFTTSLPFDSVSDWFLATTVPLAALSLPILRLSEVWPHPVLYLIPTQGPLLLLGAAFEQTRLAPWQVAYAVTYPVLCSAILYNVAHRLFRRFVAGRV
jgi:fluoroquinolone transport system permease protein